MPHEGSREESPDPSLSSCSLIYPVSQSAGGRTQTQASQESSLGAAVSRKQTLRAQTEQRGKDVSWVGGGQAKNIRRSLVPLRLKLQVHTTFQHS